MIYWRVAGQENHRKLAIDADIGYHTRWSARQGNPQRSALTHDVAHARKKLGSLKTHTPAITHSAGHDNCHRLVCDKYTGHENHRMLAIDTDIGYHTRWSARQGNPQRLASDTHIGSYTRCGACQKKTGIVKDTYTGYYTQRRPW